MATLSPCSTHAEDVLSARLPVALQTLAGQHHAQEGPYRPRSLHRRPGEGELSSTTVPSRFASLDGTGITVWIWMRPQ
jgi:hypothetical protein